MDAFVYRRIKETEESDWWYRGLRKIILGYLKAFHPKTGGKLLDIGCGTGYLLDTLKDSWSVYGVDISPMAISMARSRNLKHIYQASIEKLPFKNNSFDAIFILDVIEHVQEDNLGLHEVYRVLKPGGIAIFNTPAYKFLWSYHDISAKHIRRYTTSDFTKKLKSANFKISKISYINCLLFPLALTHRLWSKIHFHPQAQTDIGSVPKPLQEIFYSVFSWETFLLQRSNLPWGLSVSAVVTK